MEYTFNGNCFLCDIPIEHAYQVKIIDEYTGDLEFVKCCSMEHAEKAQRENARIHRNRYESIRDQCIQKLN